MRKTLTDKGVANLKPRASRYAHPDPELRGFYIRVQPSGAKSFVALARDPFGKQVWCTLGNADALRIDEARELARAAIRRIKAGLAPVELAPSRAETFKDIAEGWFARHVIAKKFRTADEIRRILEVYIYPKWADREFIGIKRRDVAALLDHIEDHHGPRMADIVLGKIGSIAGWYARRDDDFISPVIRGMTRHNKPARARILDDAELRSVWRAAEGAGKFGALVQMLLLTCQRLEKVRSMRWDDIIDGVWVIPQTDHREKMSGGELPLPALALRIIERQRLGRNPFVFPGRGDNAMDVSKSKYVLDEILPDIRRWTLHDLRR